MNHASDIAIEACGLTKRFADVLAVDALAALKFGRVGLPRSARSGGETPCRATAKLAGSVSGVGSTPVTPMWRSC